MSGQVKELEAGAEMNAEVARRVMGWRWATLNPRIYPVSSGRRVLVAPDSTDAIRRPCDESVPLLDGWQDLIPDFSTDIAAAWEVAEKMMADGWSFSLDRNGIIGQPLDDWDCLFARGQHPALFEATAATAPLAICLSALKCVGAAHAP